MDIILYKILKIIIQVELGNSDSMDAITLIKKILDE